MNERQTATYVQTSPWPLQLLLWIAAFTLAFCIHATTADAGQLPTNRSWKKYHRQTVLKPIRIKARADNGFPLRQAVANTTLALAYGAGTAYRVSGWIPTPGGVIANIIFARPASPQSFQGSRPCQQKRR